MTLKTTDLLTKQMLRPYQQRLITHLYEHDSTLARLPMGAGKTVSTLTAIAELLRDHYLHRVLVVAPLRVATLVWMQDAARWEHLLDLPIGCACGTAGHRQRVVTDLSLQVVTINVENFPWLVEAGHLRLFDGIVFDEITRFKAPTGKRLKVVEKAVSQVPWRVGLTGSIRPHHVQDVFAPMKLISNDRPLGKNITAFRNKFCFADPYIKGRYHPLPDAEALVAEAIKPWVYEISDEEYSAQLPELNIVRVPVQMPESARAAYRDMKYTYETGGVEAPTAAVAAMKLLQIASGFLYETTYEADAEGEVLENRVSHHLHTAKSDALEEIAADSETPFLVAYWFEEDLTYIKRALGCPHIGAGVSHTEAQRLVNLWNAGKLPHLAVHPASVGHGLNMQDGGNTIVWYTGTYSGELMEQLIARLRRSGQTASVVNSLHLIAAEIDDAVLQTALNHQKLQDIFVQYLRG